MKLFDWRAQQAARTEAPLAARMRPRTLDEFIGQDHIVGRGRLLRRAIEADQLSSLIFYGPPGTGKTTLAQVIANSTEAHFDAINAVLAGVADIRTAVAGAKDRRGSVGQRTILFVDEVHRFNKAQQDALLPWVESGTVILIGATTENPYFEVNKALVSRSRIFQLRSLGPAELRMVLDAALKDRERGYGRLDVAMDADAAEHLINVCNGDARALLNALELAVETTPPTHSPDPDALARIEIDLAVAEESIQRRAVLYDKEGDAHFDTISAFIKSVRGSDPDATLYWLAKMVYAGEDPRFIFRRMLILASEDVGLADPNAVVVVSGCASSFDRIGMPEGRFHLAQAALYLATCPKSNSTMGFFDALRAVRDEREGEVPNPLRDGSRDKEGFGHGEGYLYPHAYRDHWVAQQYLPSAMQGRVFYEPSEQGYEGTVKARVERDREAQLAAMVEGIGVGPVERLTSGPEDPRAERWLQRAVSRAGAHLAELRDHVFEALDVARYHTVLDLDARTGLLTWEALRATPEGGVWALTPTAAEADSLRQAAQRLPGLVRPQVLLGDLAEVAQLVGEQRFDRVAGRNALCRRADKGEVVGALASVLAPAGTIVLAEYLPRRSQRLTDLVDAGKGDSALFEVWREAEARAVTSGDVPLTGWDADDLRRHMEVAGLQAQVSHLSLRQMLFVSESVLGAWFSPEPSSYGGRLAACVDADTFEAIAEWTRRALAGTSVDWNSCYVLAVGMAGS